MNLDNFRDDLDRRENCKSGKSLAERVAEVVLVGAGLAVLGWVVWSVFFNQRGN